MALLGGSFPSFDALPQVFNFGGRYRDSAENPKYYLSVKNRDVPRLHWVLMGEITSSSCAFRHEQRITTLHGERDVRIMFYHDASETSKFDLSKLRVGSTLAILYAHQKLFLDLTKGVRQENLSSVMVFNSPISIVRSEAGKPGCSVTQTPWRTARPSLVSPVVRQISRQPHVTWRAANANVRIIAL
jgi:hypothetical protein